MVYYNYNLRYMLHCIGMCHIPLTLGTCFLNMDCFLNMANTHCSEIIHSFVVTSCMLSPAIIIIHFTLASVYCILHEGILMYIP